MFRMNNYSGVNIMLAIKRVKKKISLNVLSLVKYSLFFIVISSSFLVYITESSVAPNKFLIFPTETLYSQAEYDAALWLKTNVSPNQTVVIADYGYSAAFVVLSEFNVIRFSPYTIGPFVDLDENPLTSLNRIIVNS